MGFLEHYFQFTLWDESNPIIRMGIPAFLRANSYAWNLLRKTFERSLIQYSASWLSRFNFDEKRS